MLRFNGYTMYFSTLHPSNLHLHEPHIYTHIHIYAHTSTYLPNRYISSSIHIHGKEKTAFLVLRFRQNTLIGPFLRIFHQKGKQNKTKGKIRFKETKFSTNRVKKKKQQKRSPRPSGPRKRQNLKILSYSARWKREKKIKKFPEWENLAQRSRAWGWGFVCISLVFYLFTSLPFRLTMCCMTECPEMKRD